MRRSVGASEGNGFLPRGAVSPTDSDSVEKGVEPTLTGKALLADVPEIAEVADVSTVSFRQAASGELTVDVRGGIIV
jgi:hypothetical protein